MGSICNPVNIPYQYQHYGKAAHREAADPTMILYKNKYYLFASMSGGFYWSEDLQNWHYHQNKELDLYRYAPDVREVNGKLIFCASTRNKPSTFWRTDDPLSDKWERVSDPFDFWDPNTFQDDDGRVYFYWGCDAGKPIYGIELDPMTLTPIGEKKELIFDCHDTHGWERNVYPGAPEKRYSLGEELLYFLMKISGHGGKNSTYIEGAYMNKWNGRYYLQYSAPATESATYGDGVYVGDSPLGPFTYQVHNPVSFKPSGFMTGAGHGSTIEDKYGNLWHTATMRVSVNANFERRIGLFPAGLDKDGIFFCNQNFADYPMEIPEGRFNPMTIMPKWMLLSYNKTVTASSYISGYEPKLAVNEDVRTCWCANASTGEWMQVDLGEIYEVSAVQINFADVGIPVKKVDKKLKSDFTTNSRWIDLNKGRYTRWTLESSTDGVNWSLLIDKSEAETDLSNDYIALDVPVKLQYLRLTAKELPYGARFAVSGFRVFGKGNADIPDEVTEAKIEKIDDMTAKVSWNPAFGAQGYNVRYGIAPDKLYLSHLIYDETEVLLTALNKGQKYYVCVDSFGEGGIREGKTIKLQ